jgi:hypothetical protein
MFRKVADLMRILTTTERMHMIRNHNRTNEPRVMEAGVI